MKIVKGSDGVNNSYDDIHTFYSFLGIAAAGGATAVAVGSGRQSL
jgi:hypothetical protein